MFSDPSWDSLAAAAHSGCNLVSSLGLTVSRVACQLEETRAAGRPQLRTIF